MRDRLADQQHSHAGHRAVHHLLIERGHRPDGAFRPAELRAHACTPHSDDDRDDGSDADGDELQWTTDEEEEHSYTLRP